MKKAIIIKHLVRIACCGGLVIGAFGCSTNASQSTASTSPNPPVESSNQNANSASEDEKTLTAEELKVKNEELLHAAAEGKVDRVRALIAEGADVNAKDSDGFPVLVVAVAFMQVDVVKLLIESGADVNIKYGEGKTPLYAISLGNEDDTFVNEEKALSIVQMLIAAKADVNYKNSDGVSPLEVAAGMGYSTVIEALIAAGADVNVQDSMGVSALHVAVTMRHLKAIEVLLKAGIDVNAVTAKQMAGMTALLLAAKGPANVTEACKAVDGIEGAYDCSKAKKYLADFSDGVKLILDAGANPNQTSVDGVSPLMFAARSDYVESVKALIKAGADVNAKDNEGHTVLQYARDNEILMILRDAGAK